MADRITIDISILQGIFGDLTKLQGQLQGVVGGAVALDESASSAFAGMQDSLLGVSDSLNGVEQGFDSTMRNVVNDLLEPTHRAQELNEKLRSLGNDLRTTRSLKEVNRLKREIAATQRELDGIDTGNMERRVGGAAVRMRGLFRRLVAPVAGAFAVGSITSFIGSVAKAAGETQAFQGSLEALLKSKEKADRLNAQVKEFAAKTPFSGDEVRQATTQFIGYGFAAEDVIPTMSKLGDVAAALNTPFGDLAELFGRMKTTGIVDTLSLNALQKKGIPVIDELVNVLKRPREEVRQLVGESKVSFEQLDKAFSNMAAEGGLFYGQLAAKSATITGMISNLGDDWQEFKAKLGLALAPQITAVLGGLSGAIEWMEKGLEWITEHGPLVKKVLAGIGVVVGVYTAALVVNSAARMYNNTLQAIAAVQAGGIAIAQTVATAATVAWTAATWSLNTAFGATPIGAVILLIMALVGAFIYAWNNIEGFRAFLTGFWEMLKVQASGAVDLVVMYFKGLVEVLKGVGNAITGVFTLNPALILEGISQAKAGIATLWDDLPSRAREIGVESGLAFAKGSADGHKSFQESKERKASGTNALLELSSPGSASSAPGNNMGASELVGGAPKGSGGVTVGGEGGNRIITMNIEMRNDFRIPRDANLGVRDVVDQVVAQLVNKLNDAQFALS